MLNRAKRDQARKLVNQFMEGEITNDEFAENYRYDVSDRCLKEIYERLWFFFDDLHTHTLDGKHFLRTEDKELFNRCILFLATDLGYEWPTGAWSSFSYLVLRAIGLRNRVEKRFEKFKKAGDFQVWPFIRREDYLAAKGSANALIG